MLRRFRYKANSNALSHCRLRYPSLREADRIFGGGGVAEAFGEASAQNVATSNRAAAEALFAEGRSLMSQGRCAYTLSQAVELKIVP